MSHLCKKAFDMQTSPATIYSNILAHGFLMCKNRKVVKAKNYGVILTIFPGKSFRDNL